MDFDNAGQHRVSLPHLNQKSSTTFDKNNRSMSQQLKGQDAIAARRYDSVDVDQEYHGEDMMNSDIQ